MFNVIHTSIPYISLVPDPGVVLAPSEKEPLNANHSTSLATFSIAFSIWKANSSATGLPPKSANLSAAVVVPSPSDVLTMLADKSKGFWFWVDELWLVRIDEAQKALQEQVILVYESAVAPVVPQEHVELHAAMGADHVEGSIGMTPLLAESEVLGELAQSRVGFPVRRGEVVRLERAEPLPDVHGRFPPRSLVRPDSAMRTPRPFGWYFVHLVLQALQDVPGVW